jgi:superoxide dismutase, Fe-Mn family
MSVSRRQLLSWMGMSAGAIALQATFPRAGYAASGSDGMPIASPTTAPYVELPPLNYAYNALEPFIDERTMKIHHDLHHAAYVKNLNAAFEKYPKLKDKALTDHLRTLNKLPEDIRAAVRNNGGGHYNHAMFWESMAPNAGGEPGGELADAIQKTFGSFAEFQKQFNEAGIKRFGSGWVWLALTRRGTLAITSTPNQDNPLMVSDIPILGNDLWEHAYYLLYQNRRGEYLEKWWNVLNWPVVNERYKAAIA